MAIKYTPRTEEMQLSEMRREASERLRRDEPREASPAGGEVHAVGCDGLEAGCGALGCGERLAVEDGWIDSFEV